MRIAARKTCRRWGVAWCGLGLGALLLGGCATGVQDQRLVSKPNMLFTDSPVFSYYSSVLPQLETGAAVSGGAQASTCSACR